MKKAIYLSMLAVCGLVACSKAEQDAPVVNPVTSRTVTLIASSSLSDNDTKAVFTDGTGFAWETADLTNVGISQSGSNVKTKIGGSIDANGNAILKADVADGNFYAYFPYNSTAAGVFDIAAVQTTTAGSFSGIKLASDEIAIASETTEASVKFHVAGHLLRFYVYDGNGSTEKVNKIDVNANCPLSGTYTYNFASKTGAPSATAQQVEVSLSAPYDLSGITDAAGAESVFASILPGTTSWIDYVVTTDQNIYTFHSTNTRTFAEGKVTEVKLNLQKATTVTPVSSKIGLTYHFTDKSNSMSGRLSQNIAAAGVSNMDLGWFIVAEDGVEKVDYSKPYYTEITSNNEVSWVRAFKGGTNNLYITCDSNPGEDERVATLNVYFNETAEYVVVGTHKNSTGDYESISATDPIISIAIRQAGTTSKTQVVYDFYAGDYHPDLYDFEGTVGSGASSFNTAGRFYVRLNGGSNTMGEWNADYLTNFSMTAYDKDSDAVVTWVKNVRILNDSGNRKLQFDLEENDGAARTAVVYVYASDKGTYTVVGRVNTGGSITAFADVAEDKDKYVYKFEVTQPGA